MGSRSNEPSPPPGGMSPGRGPVENLNGLNENLSSCYKQRSRRAADLAALRGAGQWHAACPAPALTLAGQQGGAEEHTYTLRLMPHPLKSTHWATGVYRGSSRGWRPPPARRGRRLHRGQSRGERVAVSPHSYCNRKEVQKKGNQRGVATTGSQEPSSAGGGIQGGGLGPVKQLVHNQSQVRLAAAPVRCVTPALQSCPRLPPSWGTSSLRSSSSFQTGEGAWPGLPLTSKAGGVQVLQEADGAPAGAQHHDARLLAPLARQHRGRGGCNRQPRAAASLLPAFPLSSCPP